MAVTELDIKRQIRRLKVVFNTSKPEDQLVEAWKWILMEEVDHSELMAAVREYAEGGHRFFPNPGQILELIRAKRSPVQYTEGDTEQDDGVECLVCGAQLEVLAPEDQVWTEWDGERYANILPPAKAPRLGILHSYRSHREARADIVGSYRR